MNVEVYSYSVLASILGIMIVFLSLCALSLLMVLLKVVFGEKEKKKPITAPIPEAAGVSPVPSGPAITAVKRQDNNWIMAAVAAFLASEDENSPSASGWTAGTGEKSDPWLNRVLLRKNK